MRENDNLFNPLNCQKPQQTQANTAPQPTSEVISAQLSQSQRNNKSLIFSLAVLLVISLFLSGYFAYQNIQLKKDLSSQILPPLIPITPSPTIGIISDWKIYKNDTHGFLFKYPTSWQVGTFKHAPDMLTLQPQTSFIEEAQNNSIVISVSNHCLNTQCLTIMNLDDMVIQWNATKIGEITINGVKAYKISYPDNKSGYMFIKGDDFFSFATDNYLTDLDQIITTFMFTEITTFPTSSLLKSKKVKYSVPIGWKTIADVSNSFQLSYDTTKLNVCHSDQNGIHLCAQYGSYFSASVLPYGGGSRHQFIYNNGLGTPKKDDLWSDYREQEYVFDGKSCLFLNGITISQYPAVWGMCVIDNTRAVLFTSYDRTESIYEDIFKTFRSTR